MSKLFEPSLPKQFFKGFPEIAEDINVQSIQCPICLDICVDAVIENVCGHTFCAKCFEQLFINSRDGLIKCPQTRALLAKEQTGPNRALRDLVSQLKVSCVLKHQGCTWQGRYVQLEQHLKSECRKIRLRCLNPGCDFLKKRRLAESHAAHCQFRAVICRMCNNSFSAKDLEEHEESCSYRQILCPYGCLQKIRKCDHEKHYNEECKNKVINCEFKAFGCTVKVKRLRYQEHLKENSDFHISLLKNKLENVQTEYGKLNNEVETLRALSATEEFQKVIQDKTLEVQNLKEELETTKQTNENLLIQNQRLEMALIELQNQEEDDGCSFDQSIEFYDVDHSVEEENHLSSDSSCHSSRQIPSREGFVFDVQKEGWMYKKSKFLKKWRKRWFVLTSTFLYTYQQEKNYSHATEQIPLKTIREILEQVSEDGFYIIQIKQKNGCVFHLRTNFEEEKDSWLIEIQRCLQNI